MKKQIKKSITSIVDIEDERKTVIYVRESSKGQVKEGYNMHTQELKCKNFINAVFDDTDLEKVCIYRESGYSAKTIKRPKLDILLNEIKDGKVKCVVVQKLDRLARRSLGMQQLMSLFIEHRVRLITLREGIDTNSPFFKIGIAMNTLLAEIEQDTISERTNEALEYGASVGSYIKGGKSPFGTIRERVYKEKGHHLVILKRDPIFWSVLEKIYHLAYHGVNCTAISTYVNGLSVMKENNQSLSEDTIEKILRNKIYCGIQIFKEKEYKVCFESCLSEKYWKQVQVNRSIHFKRETKLDYLYHHKIHCECGTICVVDTAKKKLADGSYKHYKYYVCPKCGKRISETFIYENAEAELKKHYDYCVSGSYEETQKQRIKRIDSLNDTIYEMYIRDEIPLSELEKRLIHSQKTKERIEKNIARGVKDYDSLSFSERKEFIDVNVENIIIHNKHVEINYL